MFDQCTFPNKKKKKKKPENGQFSFKKQPSSQTYGVI